MANDGANLGQQMRDTARGVVGPAVREGRVSKVLPNRLEVAVRSLMGDAKTVSARGYSPRVADGGGGIVTLVEATHGDRVWVAKDEGGAYVVVAWEPLG